MHPTVTELAPLSPGSGDEPLSVEVEGSLDEYSGVVVSLPLRSQLPMTSFTLNLAAYISSLSRSSSADIRS